MTDTSDTPDAPRSLDDYAEIVGVETIESIRRLGARSAGLKLLMVNSARHTGGVSENVARLVPLLREVGVHADWETIGTVSPEFHRAAKTIWNGLMGAKVEFSSASRGMFEATAARYRQQVDTDPYDVVVVHDPHPVGLVSRRQKSQKWVWRCHEDISRPDRRVWRFVRPMIELYDASVYSLPHFANQLRHQQYIIPPSIDPLSPKNVEMDEAEIDAVLAELGVPRDLPLVLQVSRFDRFKDPVGVIEAWRRVVRSMPCRLVLAGGVADDDPDGHEVLEEVRDAVREDDQVHVLLLPFGAVREINALQRAADIVVQKSTKEGFGLTVAEAMFKSRPVVGASIGGIRAQVRHGRTGYLVSSVEGAAHRIRHLLHRRTEAWRMGQAGHQVVLNQFLVTRHLRDYLLLLFALEARGRREIMLKADGQLVA